MIDLVLVTASPYARRGMPFPQMRRQKLKSIGSMIQSDIQQRRHLFFVRRLDIAYGINSR